MFFQFLRPPLSETNPKPPSGVVSPFHEKSKIQLTVKQSNLKKEVIGYVKITRLRSRPRSAAMGVFKEHEADLMLHRTLAYISVKAAEIDECLYVAQRIEELMTFRSCSVCWINIEL